MDLLQCSSATSRRGSSSGSIPTAPWMTPSRCFMNRLQGTKDTFLMLHIDYIMSLVLPGSGLLGIKQETRFQ
ncbi:unnamed protein product [Urochloa humidicola]